MPANSHRQQRQVKATVVLFGRVGGSAEPPGIQQEAAKLRGRTKPVIRE